MIICSLRFLNLKWRILASNVSTQERLTTPQELVYERSLFGCINNEADNLYCSYKASTTKSGSNSNEFIYKSKKIVSKQPFTILIRYNTLVIDERFSVINL